jgi:hypothetical protein
MNDEQKFEKDVRYVQDRWLPSHLRGDGLHVDGQKFTEWDKAKAFTEQREKDIAEVEEEIALLDKTSTISPAMEKMYVEKGFEFSPDFLRMKATLKRILAYPQDRLKALRQGMVAK